MWWLREVYGMARTATVPVTDPATEAIFLDMEEEIEQAVHRAIRRLDELDRSLASQPVPRVGPVDARAHSKAGA